MGSSMSVESRVVGRDITRFRSLGFSIRRAFFSPAEIASLATVALSAFHADLHPEIAGQTYGKASFKRSFNLWQRFDEIRAFAFDQRLTRFIADLLGVDALRLLGDDVFYKEPDARVSSWHFDREFVPIDRDAFVSVWIPFQQVKKESGCLAYASQSHTEEPWNPPFYLRHEIARHVWFEQSLRFRGHSIVPIEADVGDVLVHHGRTYHMAFANRTSLARAAYGLHFIDARSRFIAPSSALQEQHVAECAWDTLRPGDEVDVPTCPIVFDRSHDRRTLIGTP
jgi:hypothetical protein